MRSEAALALAPQYDPKDFQSASADEAAELPPPPRVGFRERVLKWSGAMAASFVLVVILFAALPMPTAYATAKGERRTVPLANGTTVTLNTDTRIKVYDDEGQQRIQVLRGEVLIEGTSNATPTVVEVDGKHLRAATATFVVRKLDGQPTQVLVQDGRVDLAEATPTAAGTPAASIPLSSNTGASLLEGKETAWQLRALSLGQISRELAWREGKIALQGEPLSEAVALYARYSDMPIVIADPALGDKPVTGLFAVNNPLGFSQAVADVFGAEVRQESDRIVIATRH
jgi:transmembrane sensor